MSDLFFKSQKTGRCMTEQNQKQLGKTLSGIADQLRGAMSLDDFCDNRFSFLILRYISITSATAPTL